jgi:hypothetical protein
MTRKDFTSILLDNSIDYITIVRVPDWNGGHSYKAVLNEPDYKTGDFEYIEFEGDASKAASHHSMEFYAHREPFHEEAYDFFDGSLADLVVEELGRIQEFREAQTGTLEPAM